MQSKAALQSLDKGRIVIVDCLVQKQRDREREREREREIKT